MREHRNRDGIENLPKLFRHGGYFKDTQRKRCSEEEGCVHAVMAWVSAHAFEHRRVMQNWGPFPKPDVAGISMDWMIYHEPAPSRDHPVGGASLSSLIMVIANLWYSAIAVSSAQTAWQSPSVPIERHSLVTSSSSRRDAFHIPLQDEAPAPVSFQVERDARCHTAFTPQLRALRDMTFVGDA